LFRESPPVPVVSQIVNVSRMAPCVQRADHEKNGTHRQDFHFCASVRR
jgi:hypothetical protein